MTAISTTETENKEQVTDDISNEKMHALERSIDDAKLAALKAKSQAKQQENKMAPKIVGKKERSLNFGVLGSGQAGGRLASCFAKLGYESIACNTALVDLRSLDLPDANKLLLEYGLGGAAKSLEIGAEAANSYRGEILQLINEKLSNSQVNILCLSLGGGSGSGSCETLIDILNSVGKPVIVLAALPMATDDALAKKNSLITLSKLASLTREKRVNNLIVIDNAKLEAIYSDVGQMDFFNVSNMAAVSVLDSFNTLSATPSAVKGLDSMEFAKLLIEGEGLSVYGELTVSNFEEDTAIAEAVVNNLNGNLLASNFDLTQARYVGVIVTANKETWAKIPASSINYAMHMINDQCGSPIGVFKGIYTVETNEPVVKVLSFFSGLQLPTQRVEQLRKESKELEDKSKVKDQARSMSLKIDTGVEESVSAAQSVKNKIMNKNSALGKLLSNSISDRRK